MRRGWILLLTFTVLLFGGGVAWWWSTPGQLWWMTKKWEWWVLPKFTASPGGATYEAIVEDLNPQWDRLLRRKVVVPYNRVWDPAPAEEQIDAFGDRIGKSIRFTFPPPMSGAWGAAKYVDGKQVSWNTPDARTTFHLQLLIAPDQHHEISQMAQEVFGSDGMAPDKHPVPSWWITSWDNLPP